MNTDIFCKANKDAAEYIEAAILRADSIGIVGHIRPDGDDVGSCLGLARYISLMKPSAKPKVFLEKFPKELYYLAGADEVISDFSEDEKFDLCFMLDCSDINRMGEASKYFTNASEQICIDHHATNDGTYTGFSVVNPERSSACEVVCTLIDMDKLDAEAAECLFLGIVHDSGIFKYTSTSPETMLYAGKLMEKGAKNNYVIDKTFCQKTFLQNKALGRALTDAKLSLEGKFISSIFTKAMMDECGVVPMDLDGVVAQLRETTGVEAAIFVYETNVPGRFKISLRSNDYVDVSRVAQLYGGGGHIKAAGCEIEGDPEEIVNELEREIAKQI